MRVYLAAAWSRKEEIAGIAYDLVKLGVDVQARWLAEPSFPKSKHALDKFLRERALIDVHDVRAADILVRFSDDLNCENIPAYLGTGSRMVEMGIALERGIPVIVVGGHQPVFDHLPQVMHLKDVEELKAYLSASETTEPLT